MRARAYPSVHHREQDAVFVQCLNHLVAGHSRTVRSKEHQVGFGLLYLDAIDLRQAPRERAGIGMIVRKAGDVMIERVDAGRRANARLPHRTAEPLLPAPDIVDEIAATSDDAADRRAET